MSAFSSLSPSAFIFHTSRCGSTLFAKALARQPSNLILNQPGPFQRGFWAEVTDDFRRPLTADRRNLESFRTLLLLMARRRLPDHDAVFVKFISWNVLYIDFIMRAFPDVPAIFLYRDPVEIVASVRNSATAILEAKGRLQAEFLTGLSRPAIDRMGATEYLAHCYRRSFETVAAWRSDRLSLLDYSELSSDRFADILSRAFGLTPDQAALDDMRAQFSTYSKDDDDKKSFDLDRESKRKAIHSGHKRLIADIAGAALQQTRQDPRNLFAPRGLSSQTLQRPAGRETAA